MAKGRKASGRRGRRRSITISIDLSALDKLYRRRYDVSLDGDTKGDLVRVLDGDTKGGMRVRDGDTNGGRALPKRLSKKRPRPSRKKSRRTR